MLRTYFIAFNSADHARVFVKRLHLEFDRDVSTFRSDEQVIVFDATPRGVGVRISQLSHISSATTFKAIQLIPRR